MGDVGERKTKRKMEQLFSNLKKVLNYKINTTNYLRESLLNYLSFTDLCTSHLTSTPIE